MEVGEYIYCHTTGRMNGDGEVFAYKGKRYKIDSRGSERIWFIDEGKNDHCWPLEDEDSIDLFNKYFSVIPTTLANYYLKPHTFKS